MDDERRVASVDEARAVETTLLFRVRDRADGDVKEAILVPLADGEIVGWLNYCQHYTDVTLDKGSGASMRNGELICVNHGAYFEADTGFCNYGPCEGAFLTEIEVTIEDGAVYLTDDDYEFVGRGPIERDPIDRSSKSNLEF